jgi:hypothetical protein
MLSPVATEREYQKLLAVLSLPSSPLRRVRALARFLQRFSAETPANELYIAECLQHLPLLLPALLPQACDPSELLVYFDLFTGLKNRLQEHVPMSRLNDALQGLRRTAAALLCYVGATEEAVRVLLHFDTERLASLHLETFLDGCEDPYARARITREYVRRPEHEVSVALDEISLQWWQMPVPETGGVVIPVLEEGLTGEGAEFAGGMLRRMYVKYFSRSTDGGDHLHLDASFSGADGPLEELSKNALRAARTLLKAGGLEEISCAIGFEPKEFLQKGRSGGFALAMLLYASVLRLRGGRTFVDLRNDVVVTGDIAESGEVLPVDPRGLEQKVSVAFFSPFRTFVVPASQVAAAEAEVLRLRRLYPHRTLEIVGVRHLRDAVNDLRIVRHREQGRIAYGSRVLWRHRSALFSVIAAVGIIVTLVWTWPGRIDGEPALLAYNGEKLLVKNSVGRTLRAYDVGVEAVGTYEQDMEHLRTFSALVDVNGDGRKELIYCHPGKGNGWDELRCVSLASDSTLWTYAFQKKVTFPRKPDIRGDDYRLFTFAAGDFVGDGHPLVVAVADQVFFPSLVIKLDARTGQELDFFLNTGELGALAVLPGTDGGEGSRIIVGGVNNAYQEAIVAGFNPRYIHGCSPSQGGYAPGGIDPGLETWYIRIPKTMVGKANPHLGRTNGVIQLRLEDAGEQFVVRVIDTQFEGENGAPPMDPAVFLWFDTAFRILNTSTSTDYDGLAEKLHREGVLSRPPDAAYWNRFEKSLLYWDGKTWRREAVPNTAYVDVASNHGSGMRP